MQTLNEAWSVLRDARRRWEYDVALGARPRATGAAGATWAAGASGGDVRDAADLLDDRPVGGEHRARQRGGRVGDLVLLVPAALLAAGVATMVFATMTFNAGLITLAFLLLVLSGAAFVVSPFIALARQRGRRFRWR